MRNAESRNGTEHHSRTGTSQSRNRSLESHVIRKAVTRGSEGGGWKSAQLDNSLAAYPTSCTVPRGRGASNGPLLPDRTRSLSEQRKTTMRLLSPNILGRPTVILPAQSYPPDGRMSPASAVNRHCLKVEGTRRASTLSRLALLCCFSASP
jgi:hypothetical protein